MIAIYQICHALNEALAAEQTMLLKPRPKLKGIPIGGSFKATDGKIEPKPKRAKLTPPAQYAAKNKRRWKSVK